ncbi:MAG: outer membrane protein TolC, partial [Bacteroidota bacterium]|nr:outer membrane protein TolC [Bacteroidota bacterium]
MRPLKIILLLLISLSASAQSDVLNNYIKEGIANNEAIHQQNFQLKKSIYALKEATGLFFPSIGLEASYVDSRGGRTIDFPIGDIMNPVYKNLNAINEQMVPNSPKYPMLNNVSEQLNPTNFYDAYFKATLPIVNAEIWYNHSIKKDQIKLQQDEVDIYKRELVKDIKTAYFNYLKATEAITIYQNAMQIVKESERVNQKLVDNGKEVVYVLSRSKSEVSKIDAQITEAQNTNKNAAAYFNFLLNKPLDAEITIDESLLSNALPLPGDVLTASDKREELNKLLIAGKINQSVLSLNKSAWIPKIGAQLDLGSQASDFAFNSKSQYYLLGLSFDWSLFSGLRDVYKVKQAKLEIDALNSQTKYVQGQLNLAAPSS